MAASIMLSCGMEIFVQMLVIPACLSPLKVQLVSFHGSRGTQVLPVVLLNISIEIISAEKECEILTAG